MHWTRIMHRTTLPFLLFVFFFFVFSGSISHRPPEPETSSSFRSQTFIVLVDPDAKPSPFPSPLLWYASLVSSPPSSLPVFHVYHTLLHGFAAHLTPHQTQQINKTARGMLSVFPDSVLRLDTTRSPAFLGLERPNTQLSRLSGDGTDVIIGFIDTGIWPERPSFSDRGLSPIPARWRGECEHGTRFNRSHCNRKLIGARFFSAGFLASRGGAAIKDTTTTEFHSPRDSNGHGTHVASIAAGAHVAGAQFRGFARGTSRGMAPKARIAVYKVCWRSGCLMSDIIAAIDAAVRDGVDIISVSLSSASSLPFYLDPLSIATYRASQRGVFVAVSSGNEGPVPGSVMDSPPWVTTVAAGTIDRDFPAIITLGNRTRIRGVSLTPQTEFPSGPRRVVYVGNVHPPFRLIRIRQLHGRIALAVVDRHVSLAQAGAMLGQAGVAAMVVWLDELDPMGLIPEPLLIPSLTVGRSEFMAIQEFIGQSSHPTVRITSMGTKVGPNAAAVNFVAAFSSRGPNLAAPQILKPDLLAPGVSILGAWTGVPGTLEDPLDNRRSAFNIMSGTSMACPHVSGVAALIKAARPEWGPSQIKSALMTTASGGKSVQDEQTGRPANPFAFGAGLIRPDRAVDPGLVYVVDHQDYLGYFCKLNYTEEQIKMIIGEKVSCEAWMRKELNYPGFVAVAEEIGSSGVAFARRLKKVSKGSGLYKAKVVGLKGLRVRVEPKVLRFSDGDGQQLHFRLLVQIEEDLKVDALVLRFGVLEWGNEWGRHVVRSPIVVYSKKRLNLTAYS